jgi:thymidylate synthase (FAD)
MRLVKPSHKILFISPKPLETIEAAGRTCYKSEDKITEDSAEKFVKMIIKQGHLSVIEHAMMSVKFICDRGVTHEIVRHRLAAYSQESTRYCNYKGGVTFVIPPWVDIEEGEYTFVTPEQGVSGNIWIWYRDMLEDERSYKDLLSGGWSPQQARSVLPNSLKTEIVMTANLREWIHVFKLRTSKAAHPQMRELMIPLLEEVKTLVPVIFDDIKGE